MILGQTYINTNRIGVVFVQGSSIIANYIRWPGVQFEIQPKEAIHQNQRQRLPLRRVSSEDLLLSVFYLTHKSYKSYNFWFRITAKAYRQPQIRSPLDSPSNFSSRCESAMSDTRTISRARIWDFIFIGHFVNFFFEGKNFFPRKS